MQQIEMISLEELIPETHSYRRFIDIWSFKYSEKQLRKIETTNPHKGFGLLRLFKCLLGTVEIKQEKQSLAFPKSGPITVFKNALKTRWLIPQK